MTQKKEIKSSWVEWSKCPKSRNDQKHKKKDVRERGDRKLVKKRTSKHRYKKNQIKIPESG